MTFCKFFFHSFTLVIRKCCPIIVFIIATIYIPTFSEGSSFFVGYDVFKFSDGSPVLFIKPLKQPISLLPFIPNSRINWRINFKQVSNLDKSFAEFSPSVGKSNKSSDLFVSVFTDKSIYQGRNENTKKESEGREVNPQIIHDGFYWLSHFSLIILSFIVGVLVGWLPFRFTLLRQRAMEILSYTQPVIRQLETNITKF